jgi:pSer/pThr/pTyr-binding forkhead associated (FHA) protein
MEPVESEDTLVRRAAPSIADPGIPHDDTIVREAPPIVSPPTAMTSPPRAESASSSFHSFRVNTHEPISLNIPALLGRRPVVPRISTGRPPRLVRVPSPLHEVSSTHLELRQHGNSVVVTDLKSTNGTLVTIPGASPLKLRQGESVVVSSGTVVDIGDGNIVEILPIQRLRPPSL